MTKEYGDIENKVIVQSKVMSFPFFVMARFQSTQHLTSHNLERFLLWKVGGMMTSLESFI